MKKFFIHFEVQGLSNVFSRYDAISMIGTFCNVTCNNNDIIIMLLAKYKLLDFNTWLLLHLVSSLARHANVKADKHTV